MPGGYAGKFLEVNLSTRRVEETKFQDEFLEAYHRDEVMCKRVDTERLIRRGSSRTRVNEDGIDIETIVQIAK